MNNDELNTMIIRTTGEFRSGEPGVAALDTMFEKTGLHFRRISKTYSGSEAEADGHLLSELQRSFEQIPERVEVSTFLGREQDKQTFLDVVNDMLRKQKAELNRPTEA